MIGKEMYLNSKSGKIKLSEMQSKRVGACAEKATLAHQIELSQCNNLLTIASDKNYFPIF